MKNAYKLNRNSSKKVIVNFAPRTQGRTFWTKKRIEELKAQGVDITVHSKKGVKTAQ